MREKKKYTEVKEKEIVSCDKCGKKMEKNYSYNVCSICERDICHKCFEDTTELLGGLIIPCPFCRELKDKFIQEMRKMLAKSDEYREKYSNLQKKWGETSRKTARKKLSDTQREIVIGQDKCKKCKELLEWSRVYPCPIYCSTCHIDMRYEDQIIFGKRVV